MTATTDPKPRRNPIAAAIEGISDPIQGLPPETLTEPILRTRFLRREFVHVMDPALIQQALLEQSDAVIKGVDMQRTLGPALGQGLLTANGPHWKWQRQTAAPIFRADALRDFVPAMLRAAATTRDRLLALPPGTRPDIGRETMRTTFAIIADTMLSGGGGIEADRVATSVANYVEQTGWSFLYAMIGLPEWLPYPGKRRAMRGKLYLRSAMSRLVAERRRSGESRGDLVDRLMGATDPDTGRRMNDEEITDNLITFIAAGHETTALALAWTLDLLARHPDVMARLRAEIEAVTAGEPIAPAHLDQLRLVRQALQEGMRLYPPAPIISRQATRPMRLAGHDIRPGAMLIIPIWSIHRHRALWTDPSRFDLDRFDPAVARARHRFAYMPFGAGPRICIGSVFAMNEAVAVLAVLVRALDFVPVTIHPPRPRMVITLRPADPILLGVAPRADRADT